MIKLKRVIEVKRVTDVKRVANVKRHLLALCSISIQPENLNQKSAPSGISHLECNECSVLHWLT